MGFIPQSFVQRCIVLGRALIYRDWSIQDLKGFKFLHAPVGGGRVICKLRGGGGNLLIPILSMKLKIWVCTVKIKVHILSSLNRTELKFSNLKAKSFKVQPRCYFVQPSNCFLRTTGLINSWESQNWDYHGDRH